MISAMYVFGSQWTPRTGQALTKPSRQLGEFKITGPVIAQPCLTQKGMFDTRKMERSTMLLMGKSTISMAIFHCYVSSPEGSAILVSFPSTSKHFKTVSFVEGPIFHTRQCMFTYGKLNPQKIYVCMFRLNHTSWQFGVPAWTPMILINYIYIYTISDSIAMRLLLPISSWPNDLSLRHSSGELTICDGTSALKPIRIFGRRTSARKYVRLFFRAWRNTAMWLKFHEKTTTYIWWQNIRPFSVIYHHLSIRNQPTWRYIFWR